ncbi:hypothetical protein [Clostridium perfringens]|uniref:hypothetical protein n=1 Tax=Clostridium perfringens TaxID=1502 RepID=UPI0039EBCC3D
MEYNRKQTSLEPIDILKFDTVETGAVFKQYDINTSILELELVANGEPVHLKDEKVYVTVKSSNSLSTQLLSKYSGASVKEKDNYKVLLRAKKSRRRDVNNIIDVYISPLALENSGEMVAEVMIIDLIKEERITSQSFTFEIKPSITPNRPSESAYKLVKDLDGTYITDAEDVQLLVAEVEPNFKLSFVGTRVNEILEKANNFDVEDNTNKIQALQEKDVELESKISNLEKKDSSLDGEIASLKSSDQNIEEEIQGLKTKDESIESEISQLKSKDTEIDGEIDKLKNADETIKSDINSKYEELKQKTDATNNEVMKLKAQDTTLGESIRTNKGLIDVINPKVSTLEQDNQNVKNRVSVLEGDMNLAKSNISSLQSSNTELSQKVEGVEQGNASIDKILKQLQSDVERYKSSIELLESKVPVWKDFKGESFKVENSFYGKSKDLSIKGKTLQNIIKMGDFSLGEIGSLDGATFKISRSSTQQTAVPLSKKFLQLLKSNTVYTVMAKIENNTLNGEFALIHSFQNIMFTKSPVMIPKGFNGVVSKKFTTIDDISLGDRMEINFQLVTGTVDIKNLIILEGDYTDTYIDGYFEGINSIGDYEYNYLDESQIVPGYIGGADGITLNLNADDGTRIAIIPCESNTIYTITKEFVTDRFLIGTTTEKPINGMKVTRLSQNNGKSSITIKTPVDAKYLLAYLTSNIKTSSYGRTSINKGTCKTWSEPHKHKVSILSNGKNLFDYSKLTDGEILTFNNRRCFKFTDNSTNFSLNVNGEKNKQYTISIKMYRDKSQETKRLNVQFVYSDGTFKTYNLDHDVLREFTTESGKTLVKVKGAYNHSMNAYIDLECTQLEEGIKSTEFEPYKCYKKDISLQSLGFDEGFRGLNDSVYDELNDVKRETIKRIDKKVLTGNEQWIMWTNSTGDVLNCYLYFDRMIPNLTTVVKPNSIILNDRFPSNIGGHLSRVEGFRVASNYFTLSIHKSKLGIQDVNDTNNLPALKRWLNENPVTVYYELKEPIITPLNEDVNFGTLDDLTYVSLENNIKNELSCQCQVSLASVSKA